MITLKLQFGNSIISGLTFSSDAQVEEIEGYIGVISVGSQIAHLLKRSRTDQQGVFSSISEDITITNNLSIIMQADSDTDVEYIEGKYAGLKNVVVELVPNE